MHKILYNFSSGGKGSKCPLPMPAGAHGSGLPMVTIMSRPYVEIALPRNRPVLFYG